MRRCLASLLIVILGTMPMLVMGKTAGANAQDVQEMPCHQSAPKPDSEPKGDCDFCKGASQCCATFIPPAAEPGPGALVGAVRIADRPGLASGIVLPPLDPPPLVL
jgi:hypothetical protein